MFVGVKVKKVCSKKIFWKRGLFKVLHWNLKETFKIQKRCFFLYGYIYGKALTWAGSVAECSGGVSFKPLACFLCRKSKALCINGRKMSLFSPLDNSKRKCKSLIKSHTSRARITVPWPRFHVSWLCSIVCTRTCQITIYILKEWNRK